MNMNHISVKTQTSNRTTMCDAASWSGLDNYGSIRTQSFNPENKNQE